MKPLLTPAQVAQLLAELPTDLDRLRVQFIIATSLRWRELAEVRWVSVAPGEVLVGDRRVALTPGAASLLPRLWTLTGQSALLAGADVDRTRQRVVEACRRLGLPPAAARLRELASARRDLSNASLGERRHLGPLELDDVHVCLWLMRLGERVHGAVQTQLIRRGRLFVRPGQNGGLQ